MYSNIFFDLGFLSSLVGVSLVLILLPPYNPFSFLIRIPSICLSLIWSLSNLDRVDRMDIISSENWSTLPFSSIFWREGFLHIIRIPFSVNSFQVDRTSMVFLPNLSILCTCSSLSFPHEISFSISDPLGLSNNGMEPLQVSVST